MGANPSSHTHTDGAADLPSADVGLDPCPNCAADSKPVAATHRVAVMAAHAATDALPDLRVRTTVRSSLCGPNALADVLPEPCTDNSDPKPVAFHRAHASHALYHADGPADATHAHIGAHKAAAHGLRQVQLCLML